MKSKKITVVAILAMALVMMMACGLVAEVASIDFTNAPKAFYKLNEKAPASALKVKVTMKDDTSFEVPLTDSRLTVEGLVNGMLDTATEGTKTLKVTYMGISITVTYVVGQDSVGILWTDERVTGEGKDLYNAIVNAEGTLTLEAGKTYNVSDYQWAAPALTESLVIDGNGATIEGLTMTATNAITRHKATNGKTYSGAGFIGVVYGKDVEVTIKNLTFTNATIKNIDNANYENAKNFGVVAGYVDGGSKINVEKVVVDNAEMLGNGRVAGIIGYVCDTLGATITDCTVKNSRISGNNPVKDIAGDGEADKIGGIVGQVANNTKAAVSITGCTVDTVVINGTRDLGGLVGYLAGNATNGARVITGNTVKDVVVQAHVTGGMKFATKGFRNVGGLIGTIADDGTFTITGNKVENGNRTGYAEYESLTSVNLYIGGLRHNANPTVNGAATYNVGSTETDTFKTNHVNMVNTLNEALAALN